MPELPAPATRLEWIEDHIPHPIWRAQTGSEGTAPALLAGWQIAVTPSVGPVRGWIHIGWREQVIADVRHEFKNVADAKGYAEQLAEQLIRAMFDKLL